MRIGIDLGGTNTAAAIVGPNGEILKRANLPTRADSAGSVLAGLSEVCGILISDTQTPASIGIGVPGTVNADTGEVIFTPNLPLKGVNITRELEKKYACPVYIGNDANCAALGEVVAGGAKGAQDAVLITLGTGVGGGIIIGGALHTGVSGAAGELGHTVIVAGGRACGCGRHGCLESYGSATGLVRTANEIIGMHRESALWEISGGQSAKLNGRIIFEAFRAGDHAARLIVEQYIGHLAVGIGNIINILEPEMICIGGGISNEWESISEMLQTKVDAERFPHSSSASRQTIIVKAQLGNDAGIIGAAML